MERVGHGGRPDRTFCTAQSGRILKRQLPAAAHMLEFQPMPRLRKLSDGPERNRSSRPCPRAEGTGHQQNDASGDFRAPRPLPGDESIGIGRRVTQGSREEPDEAEEMPQQRTETPRGTKRTHTSETASSLAGSEPLRTRTLPALRCIRQRHFDVLKRERATRPGICQ